MRRCGDKRHPRPLIQSFLSVLALTAPLFLLVGVGFALMRWGRWPTVAADWLTRFVFTIAIPAFLFRLMSDFSRLPPVDPTLLIVFFGACLVVFAIGRMLGYAVFRMDGTAQSVFAMGGIFSNNVLLGVPIARIALGDAAMPAISLVLVFNALILWTLVTVSVEWARHRDLSVPGLAKTVRGVVTNPIVGGILAGTAWGLGGLPLPAIVDRTLELVGQPAVPLSLIALGMGLAEFGIREGWRESVAITVLKLAVQPLAVLLLARVAGLPELETQVVVLLAALPVGANVYLMSREFNTLEGPVAASLLVSTALAALTVPLVLTLSAWH
jgi:predicted permease